MCVCEGHINKVCAYTSIGRQADLMHSGGPVMMLRGWLLRLDSEKNSSIIILFIYLKKTDLVYQSGFFFQTLLLSICCTSRDPPPPLQVFHSLCGRWKKKHYGCRRESESLACLRDIRVLLLLPFISMWCAAVNHL